MYTPITLDKVRNFRFGMKAVHLIEKKLGVAVSKLDLDELTMEQTATIMWAGLFHEDKELTPDKIMDLIDDHSNLTDALKVMAEAFAEGFNGGEDKPKN